MIFDPATAKRKRPQRRQLNVDIGNERYGRLREYCEAKGLSIASCVRQMIDYCVKEAEANDGRSEG